MRHRRFGRTEIDIPVFSCGGMRFQESWTAGTKVGRKSQDNLQATIDRAIACGVTHIETARGYGTSEVQVGQALKSHRRDTYILQTKGPPRPDPAEFEANLKDSFERLQCEHVDLFAFHGLNNQSKVDETLKGCFDIADRYRRQGRIGHIGFSTHGPTTVIVDAINSGLFDYVNLHYYYIFQENRPALEAAKSQDMGVFVISPNDKGGHLHTPRAPMKEACGDDLSPMQFNGLFCLSHPEIHVLSLGAARPSDFDHHLEILPHLDEAAALVAPIVKKLDAMLDKAVGADYAARYLQGVPEWQELPGGVNVRKILWLMNLVKGWDLVPYAKSRYNMLSQDDHWFPGNKADTVDKRVLLEALRAHPDVERIGPLLQEAHTLLNNR